MGAKADDTKGRMKEALGDLTDDDRLKKEGQLDQAGAKAKDVINSAKESADSLVDRARDKAKSD